MRRKRRRLYIDVEVREYIFSQIASLLFGGVLGICIYLLLVRLGIIIR